MEPLNDLSGVEIKNSSVFSERVSFIYKGEKKIQCIEDGIISDNKVAVLRGKVLNENKEPSKNG